MHDYAAVKKWFRNHTPVCTLLLIFLAHTVPSSPGFAQSPLSLEDCIRLALDNNPEIRNAQRRTDIARTVKSDAIASYLPSLSTVFSSSQTRVGPQINNRVVYQGVELSEGATSVSPSFVTNSHFIGASFNQLIFDGGASINRIRQQNTNLQSALQSQTQTRSQVILQCKRLYYNLRRAQEHQQVAAKALDVAEQQARRMELLKDGGVISKLDLFRGRVARNNGRLRVLQAESTIADASADLNSYLGRSQDESITLAQDKTSVGPLQYPLEEAKGLARHNNQDLHSLQLSINARRFGIAAAKNAYLPSVNFSSSYYRYNSSMSNVYGQLTKNYSIFLGLTLSYNLFDGLRRETAIQRERLQMALAEETYDTAQRDIASTVARSYRRYTVLMEMLRLHEENVLEATEGMRVAGERYTNGQIPLIEVLEAESNLMDAQYQRIGTTYDALISAAEFDALLGVDSH
jgi:outer membrane protein